MTDRISVLGPGEPDPSAPAGGSGSSGPPGGEPDRTARAGQRAGSTTPGASSPGPQPSDGRSLPGSLAAVWALLGVAALFAMAVVRLGARAMNSLQAGVGPMEFVLLVSLVLLFVVGEGWAALQRKWVPRVVARARELRHRGLILHRLLAPLYGMSLIGAGSRTLVRGWAGVAAVIVAVLAVRLLPDPWRGMVDLAVAAALSWGLLALALEGRRVLD